MPVKGSGRTNPLVQLAYQVYPMLQGSPLDYDECDSHEAPPVAVPVREAPIVVILVRVESRSKSKTCKSGGTK